MKTRSFSTIVHLTSLLYFVPDMTSSLVIFLCILLLCKALGSTTSDSSPVTTLQTSNCGIAVVWLRSSGSFFIGWLICSGVCRLCSTEGWFPSGISTWSKYFKKGEIIFLYPYKLLILLLLKSPYLVIIFSIRLINISRYLRVGEKKKEFVIYIPLKESFEQTNHFQDLKLLTKKNLLDI